MLLHIIRNVCFKLEFAGYSQTESKNIWFNCLFFLKDLSPWGNENIATSIWKGVSVSLIHCHYCKLREDKKVCDLLLSGLRHTMNGIKLQTRPVSCLPFMYDRFCQQRPLTIFPSFLPSVFTSLLPVSLSFHFSEGSRLLEAMAGDFHQLLRAMPGCGLWKATFKVTSGKLQP